MIHFRVGRHAHRVVTEFRRRIDETGLQYTVFSQKRIRCHPNVHPPTVESFIGELFDIIRAPLVLSVRKALPLTFRLRPRYGACWDPCRS